MKFLVFATFFDCIYMEVGLVMKMMMMTTRRTTVPITIRLIFKLQRLRLRRRWWWWQVMLCKQKLKEYYCCISLHKFNPLLSKYSLEHTYTDHIIIIKESYSRNNKLDVNIRKFLFFFLHVFLAFAIKINKSENRINLKIVLIHE